MATYTVKGCSFKKNLEVETPEGLKTFALYNLILDDGVEKAIDAEWKTLPSTPEPAIDSQIDGTLEMTQYGWKFKKGKRDNLQKPNYQAAVGKPNTGRDSFRKHPAEVAGARRAHAQHMALMELAILSRDVNYDFKRLDDDEYMKTKIDWWDQDARDASEKAEED